ncbi:hypothetical protein WMF37_35185 [Sorangium sp. So ce291]|uniref:hypothetical protein n=1 Tax=Sorangium sp. So ce291 TaxID=3133294 RepID=UPI003F6455EC
MAGVDLRVVPEALAEEPFTDALEVARAARFTDEEWEAYVRAGIALQDERGALSLARREGQEEGRKEGREEGLRTAIRRVLSRRGVALDAGEDARLAACADLGTLERWLDQALTAATAAEALR